MTTATNTEESLFDSMLRRARRIMCYDREGSFTCHTVDPYISALEVAHRAEVAELRNRLDLLTAILNEVPSGAIHAPWRAEGSCIYDGDDYGSIVATFEDVDADMECKQAAASINAIAKMKKVICN